MIVQAGKQSSSSGSGVASVTAGDASITVGGTATNPTVKLPYKLYVILPNQSGTDAPTAVVLENTLGGVSFSRNDLGSYTIASTALFTLNKTAVFISSAKRPNSDDDKIYQITYAYIDSSSIALYSVVVDLVGQSVAFQDDLIASDYVTLEIRVYP